MNITLGVYRSWEISIDMIPETSGQITVTLTSRNTKIGEIFKEQVTDDKIRELFNLPKGPEASVAAFGRELGEIEENDPRVFGFYWGFMFSGLRGSLTKYEILSCIFKSIDQLMDHIKDLSEREQPTISE